MKWLFAMVLGGVVVGLVVSFPRAQDDAAEPETVGDIPKGKEPKPAAGEGRHDTEKPATSAQAVKSVEAKLEKPADAAGDVEKPTTADEPSKSGSSDAKPATGRGQSQILHARILPLKHVRAALAREVLAKKFQHEFTKSMQLEVIPKHNSLLLTVPLAMYPPILEVLRKLDQPGMRVAETEQLPGDNPEDTGGDSARSDVPGNAPANDGEEIKIHRLKNADATATRDLIRAMYPAEFKNRSAIAADARTNTLVVRGSRDLLDVIEAVLLALDETETPKRPEGTADGAAQSQPGDARGLPGTHASGAREKWRASLAMAADPDREVKRVKEELYRQEQQSAELARQYRQGRGAASPNGPALQKLKAELEAAVQSAFDTRQKAQGYELEQLRQRLATIENRLSMRERAEPEIIKQRVEQLLHPEREWEPADETSGTPEKKDVTKESKAEQAPAAANQSDGSKLIAPESIWRTDFREAQRLAQELDRPLLVHFDAAPGRTMKREVLYRPEVLAVLRDFYVAVYVDVDASEGRALTARYKITAIPSYLILARDGKIFRFPEGARNLDVFLRLLQETIDAIHAPKPASDEESGSGYESQKPAAPFSSRAATDPRKEVLDAESAITKAQSAVAAAEKSCKSARSDLSRIQDAYKKGAITGKNLRDAERQVETDEAQLEKAKLDLQLAERQAKLARENLDSQIKLLELDMQEGKLKIAHLADEESRARQLFDNKSLSKAQYDEAKLALERAKVELERISLRLELCSKPLPGKEGSALIDEKEATSATGNGNVGDGTSEKKGD